MLIVNREVLIFKSCGDDNEHENDDPYVAILRQSQFSVKTIPVLDFNFTQLTVLRESLLNPCKYSGAIFTSPRAVQAALLCLQAEPLPKEWQNLQVFVVGESTAKSLLVELGLSALGSSSGNASNLADLILQNQYTCPLLFPCGNLKRDVLPSKLTQGGIKLDIITVYQSQPHPKIEENLQLATLQGSQLSEYLVYFSPTGVQFTLPILLQMKLSFKDIKVVAIGPTTHAYLEDSQIQVWSSALKPSPEYLLKAILTPRLDSGH